MNILFLADPHSIHDEKWIRYFSENKLNNTYLLPRAGHAEKKIQVPHPSGAEVLKPIVDFSLARSFKTIITASTLRSIIKQHKIDLIHILYAEPNALWCLFRKYFGIPMIITTRGTDVLKTIPEVFEKRRLINYLVAPAYRKAFRMADWITGTSQNQIKSITSFSGRKEKFTIIRTGVNFKNFETNTALPIALPEGIKYILFPRYIRPLYNHEFAIEAIDLLSAPIQSEYKMVFLGRNSGDPSYQNLIEKKMKAISNVEFIFLPQQNQEVIFELYKQASLVVMTPHSDGSPVSAMETMLSGTKLILGPLDYDSDIFSEGTIKLKNWSVEELAQTIATALLDSKKNIVSSKLKQIIDRDYNMNQMELIYKKVLYGS